jgi:hypothetical protein
MKHIWIVLVAFSCIVTACKRRDYYIKTNDQYEKGKLSIEEIEKNYPVRFLAVSGTNKKNLLGQTVIKGTIFNNAKMVHYKDIAIKLSFYSKTKTLLEEDRDVIYETITPGGSASFKSKYFAPKGTDSVGMIIVSAKF